MDRPDVIELDLKDVVGKADRDLLVAGLQALHRERVGAWNAQCAFAFRMGREPMPRESFGIDEVVGLLRRIGSGPGTVF